MTERHDAGLDALLALDGEVFFIDREGEYCVRFVVKAVQSSPGRPQG